MDQDNTGEGKLFMIIFWTYHWNVFTCIKWLETSSALGLFSSSKDKRISKDKNKLEAKKTYKDKIKGIIV